MAKSPTFSYSHPSVSASFVPPVAPWHRPQLSQGQGVSDAFAQRPLVGIVLREEIS